MFVVSETKGENMPRKKINKLRENIKIYKTGQNKTQQHTAKGVSH